LRIYGDESKFRAALARYIKRADELLDQAEGVRKHMEKIGEPYAHLFVGAGWEEDVKRWLMSARSGLLPYLQEQADDALPVIAYGLPSDKGGSRRVIDVDSGEPWLKEARDELVAMQDSVGVQRDVSRQAPVPVRFAELRASGLIAEKVITDHEKAMQNPRTPRQLSNAIGSSKELTEATLRAALDRLGAGWDKGDELTALMKKWRKATEGLAPPNPNGRQMLDQALAALGNIIQFIAEWRNEYGTGHGRPQYPPDLTLRHARLAVDAAETSVRFIVLTLVDLQRLPP